MPWSYGIDIDAFSPITRDEALVAFVDFARHELGDDSVDQLLGPAEDEPPPSSG